MTRLALTDLAANRGRRGIPSICSAHPLVLRAALRLGQQRDATVLIEATCNQVNHQGGYTGMTPEGFASLVADLARREGCDPSRIVLGGDHLGPNPWRHLPPDQAMAEAEQMVRAYARAGFTKIHLDASMPCAGEAAPDDTLIAQRAARLAQAAESHRPLYVIGTEVPPPGGADHHLDSVTPTLPEAALRTVEIHRQVFHDAGLDDAFARAIALVVQPGVEFGNSNVIRYRPEIARDLTAVLNRLPGMVFEAHSTDYQGQNRLAALVRDGSGILKVGPEATFALREAFYALDLIASDLLPEYGDRPLYHAFEAAMLAAPADWERHYHDNPRVLRHYSYSDRIRYYWLADPVRDAVARLIAALSGQRIPEPLFSQHLPTALRFADAPLHPEELAIAHVIARLTPYFAACEGEDI